MTDNNLLITDDLKSAFADLLGRTSAKPVNINISDIKIEGKQVSLHTNPVYTEEQNTSPISNQNNNLIKTIESVSSTCSTSSSLHITPHSTPTNHNKHRSSSASTTPNRGSVLAAYIQRFRNAPAFDRNETNNNTTNDFWWIKNHTQNIHQQRPSTAPNTTYSLYHQEEKQISNQDTSDTSHQQMIINKPSDDIQILKEMNYSTPKSIKYTQNNVSKPVSMHSSPKSSIKDEDTDSDKATEATSFYFVDNDNDNDNDAAIDVDDILEKWRKNRRLKQLATENGMSTHEYQDKNVFNNDAELERIKKRLGFNNDAELEHSTPTQPFTATIHPIPFPQHSTSQTHYYEHKEMEQCDDIYTEQQNTSPMSNHKEMEQCERKTLSPRHKHKTLSFRKSNDFLTEQQYMREEKAKMERIARIQRRMCFDEKHVLDHTKTAEDVLPTGRQKKSASPAQKTQDTVHRTLNFDETDDKQDDINDEISQFVSKSVQTQLHVKTAKMSVKQSEKLKNNIINIEETKTVRTISDPTELLPQDILNELNQLYQDGMLKDMSHFDVHFKKILNIHCDRRNITNKLLKWIGLESDENGRNQNDIKLPLPSPQRTTEKEWMKTEYGDTCEFDEKSNQSRNESNEKEWNHHDIKPPLPSPQRITEKERMKTECGDKCEFDKKSNRSNDGKDNDITDDEDESESKDDEDRECKIERVLSVSLCCDISNMDYKKKENDNICEEINENDDNYKDMETENDKYSDLGVEKSDLNNYKDTCIDEEKECKIEHVLTVSVCSDISNIDNNMNNESNDIIKNWIKQHPDHYWPPSKQSDIEVIKDFVDGENVQNVKKDIHNEENCLNQVSETDQDDNEFVDNDNVHQKISIHDDVEIMTLIQSCKTLRHTISTL